MAYNLRLADRIRNYLIAKNTSFDEKKMFGGLAFLINNKMCINVSADKLMCRYNPDQHLILEKKKGFEKMNMRGKELDGYGYINSSGYTTKKDFEFWVEICLLFNEKARSSKKEK